MALSGHIEASVRLSAFGGEADMARPPLTYRSVVDDPYRTWGALKSRSAAVSCPNEECYLWPEHGRHWRETPRVHYAHRRGAAGRLRHTRNAPRKQNESVSWCTECRPIHC